ncbi:HAMP domain protein [Moorella mulderi DSM 14980]|uniref:HAMP domain protein n=1 Tax=Moorella mulderi DSM 14980 TaxID=1122241 RepID=A0A151B0F5_9FIRM|nr:HAMP domain protein [Moorella mulderi DSM 14980]
MIGAAGIKISMDAIDQKTTALLHRIVFTMALGWLLALALLAALTRRLVIKPVSSLKNVAARVAAGDLAVTWKQGGQANEIGELEDAVARMLSFQRQNVASIRQKAITLEGSSRQMEEGVKQTAASGEQLAQVLGKRKIAPTFASEVGAKTSLIIHPANRRQSFRPRQELIQGIFVLEVQVGKFFEKVNEIVEGI